MIGKMIAGYMSRPARARGLKPLASMVMLSSGAVAPRAGAWIETNPPHPVFPFGQSRPARARGLKPVRCIPDCRANSRAPRGRVD